MALPEREAFETLRSAYFVDPTKPAEPRHQQAVAFLVSQLLSVEDPYSTYSGDDPLSKFTSLLTAKMTEARGFDHLSMAQIHPSGFVPGILAHFGSTLKNNNTIIREVSPVETAMELAATHWLAEKIAGYDPRSSSGALVSGGTSANLTGLMVARERLTGVSYWRDGTAVILGTEMSHYSLTKNAAVLAPRGLIAVEKIPLEQGEYSMDTVALKERLTKLKADGVPVMAIVANAGMTETGLVDPLADIADIASENDIYLHIDAAYGGPFALSKRRSLFNGMANSNSITVDPHKNLYTPYSAGAIIFRSATEHSLLRGLNADGNDYMFKQETENNLGKRRLEGSMGGQAAASTWAVIYTLGVRGLSQILNHSLEVTNHAYEVVKGSKFFRPAFVPQLNTLCFNSIDPRVKEVLSDSGAETRFYDRATKTLEETTGIYISTTDLPFPLDRNRRTKSPVFRLVITNPYTETEHVDQMLDALQNIWDRQMDMARKAA